MTSDPERLAAPPLTRNRLEAATFDVAVIGGGVVGCACARRLSLCGARVVLIERDADILAGASKGNSALLHTGFDAPPGSLELALMRRGYREYLAIRESLNLPLLETGALVVAWSAEEEDRLAGIAMQARENGVEDARLLSGEEARAREPGLSSRARAALLVPGEHVIDAWSAPLAYLQQAMAHGATVLRGTELQTGYWEGDGWRLRTSAGTLASHAVLNCAGLYGDLVEARCLGDASFEIRPRKGQFAVFDKPAAQHLRSTILPVPNEITKGVVVARTIYGNVLVGPTAEEQPARDRAAVDHDQLAALVARAGEIVPALSGMPINAVYAGLRPASERKEYRIRHEPDRHWLTLGGIRSTGLTAALGLAGYAAEQLGFAEETIEPAPCPVPNLAEHRPRDWERPGYGEIVCHCEMVTRREIDAARASPLPPVTLGGLKRRTRATMGRCQGFYCGAKLRAIMGEGDPPHG